MKNKYIINFEFNKYKNNIISLKTGFYVKITYYNNIDNKKNIIFSGLIISVRNKGISTSIIVKKNINNTDSIEKTFFIYLPNIYKIDILKKYFFKKSKLFNINNRLNKIVKFI